MKTKNSKIKLNDIHNFLIPYFYLNKLIKSGNTSFSNENNQVIFHIYLNRLIENGDASFANENNKIIHFNHHASNYFTLGRDENMKPFIGVQEDMMPWFFKPDWSEVNLMFNEKSAYIYLISKAKNGNLNFTIGLKVQPKKMAVMYDAKRENINNSVCALKAIRFTENGEIQVYHNSIITGLKMKLINSVEDIVLA